MIDMLPDAIPPPEIVGAPFTSFAPHCIIPPLFETVHGHDVGRSRLRTPPSPLCAIPKAKGCMNIDYVEFLACLLNVFSDSPSKLNSAKTFRPCLPGHQVFKKYGFHAVSQLAQFFCQVVDNARHP